MTNNEEIKMSAPCGIYCGDCPAYTCKDDPALMEQLINGGMKREHLPCKGCREMEGNCLHIDGQCANYICTTERQHDFCCDCKDFPCEKLNPAVDRAARLPHNMKMFNLCTIKNHGHAKWLEKLPEIKTRYYTGKISFGKGPQI